MAGILPSLLAADFANLYDEIMKVQEAGYLHFDIMDGRYVPNISFGPDILRALRPHSRQVFDTHLMIVEPERYIELFAEAGADVITFHYEATTHPHRVVHQVKEAGCKVGIALNPSTPLNVLEYLLEDLDQVLVMTVNPGFGGQRFIPAMVNKISELRRIIEDRGLATQIQIDGGVNLDNLAELHTLGVDLFVLGSAVFGADNPGEVVRKAREILKKDK
ncbi:MAG: ribulose-phosphate 3-epimerase [Halanaerobiaceae bacterium]|nr:ribulose-phosphate 3-epimerase [Halanaerobiaceae bacterium]